MEKIMIMSYAKRKELLDFLLDLSMALCLAHSACVAFEFKLGTGTSGWCGVSSSCVQVDQTGSIADDDGSWTDYESYFVRPPYDYLTGGYSLSGGWLYTDCTARRLNSKPAPWKVAGRCSAPGRPMRSWHRAGSSGRQGACPSPGGMLQTVLL